MKDLVKETFPFPSIRPEQEQALDFILDNLKDKKFILLELGTGCGKSAIAACLANILAKQKQNTYILTSQKVLQEQYKNSFPLIKSIWASSNFQCSLVKNVSCGELLRLQKSVTNNSAGSITHRSCKTRCPYTKARSAFMEAATGVTNYAYFLASTMYGEGINKRNLLILDEAHRIEDELTNWVGITVKKSFCDKHSLARFPPSNKREDVENWLFKILEPSITKRLYVLQAKIGTNFNQPFIQKIAAEYNVLDRLSCSIHRLQKFYKKDNWIFDICRNDDFCIKFTPIKIEKFAHDFLYQYGDKVIFMSATILDFNLWCKTAGLNPADVAKITIESPFRRENKKIIFSPAGKMSQKHILRTLPKMARKIKTILNNHKNEKGIIHTTSYFVTNTLSKLINDDRLIFQKHGDNINKMLEKHVTSTKASVIVSPSLTEGVDLYDDISRFQIIAKLPYKYLGDPIVKARMNTFDNWYSCHAARSIMQASGRSVRHEKDYAITYILDECFFDFLKWNGTLFPKKFINSIIVK